MLKRRTDRKNLARLAFVLGIFLVLIFPAQADDETLQNEEGEDYININTQTTWHKNDNLNIKKTVYVNPGGTLIIEKGSKITFGKDLNGIDTALYVYGGNLLASGTQSEKITFSPASEDDRFHIEFLYDKLDGIPESKPSFLRYVEISKSGWKNDSSCPECVGFLEKLIPKAEAYSEDGMPAVFFEGGKVHMENCLFKENNYADIEVEQEEDKTARGDYLEIINSNFEKNDDSLAVKSEMHCLDGAESCVKKVFLKNNWYDSPSGPSGTYAGQISDGKKISGDFQLDSWKHSSLIADPVVVVPGILGSAEVSGKMMLDPIFHTYGNLLESLEQNGFEKDKTLFEFPYEWRKNNETTAMYFQSAIEDVLLKTKISKADVVAHSMGGLIVRAYIEEIEGTQYENTIDQLITLGTPHRGSPNAYLKWEAGDGFFSRIDLVGKKYFEMEAEHAGYSDLGKYIREKVTSVGELLPDYDYLFDVSGDKMRTYPDGYPLNGFLKDLNNLNNLSELEKVDFTNIIGNIQNEKSTISGFKVVSSDTWEHGMPENFYDPELGRGIEFGTGDETVPFSSSTGIPTEKPFVEFSSSHNDLPTEAQCEIIQELTGESECDYVGTWEKIGSILTFGVFSPVDIQVAFSDGSWAGKNIQNLEAGKEIKNAYYSGFEKPCQGDTTKMCENENEFLTIPEPKNGEYQIITQGNSIGGNFEIKASKIWEDETGKGQESPELLISGSSDPNEIKDSLKIVVSGDAVAQKKEEKPLTLQEMLEKLDSWKKEGLIKDEKTKKLLRAELLLIQSKLEILEMLENRNLPWWFSEKFRENLVKNFKLAINHDIDRLVSDLDKKKVFSGGIEEGLREVLKEGLEKIKMSN